MWPVAHEKLHEQRLSRDAGSMLERESGPAGEDRIAARHHQAAEARLHGERGVVRLAVVIDPRSGGRIRRLAQACLHPDHLRAGDRHDPRRDVGGKIGDGELSPGDGPARASNLDEGGTTVGGVDPDSDHLARERTGGPIFDLRDAVELDGEQTPNAKLEEALGGLG